MINASFIEFHKLPAQLKQAVTSPQAMDLLEKVESAYDVSLADVVILLMVKKIRLPDLPKYLSEKLKLDPTKAVEVAAALKNGLLVPVLSYLESPDGPPTVPTRPPPLQQVPRPIQPPAVAPVTRPFVAPPQRPSMTPAPTLVTPAPMLKPKIPMQQYSKVASGKASYYVFAEDEEEIAKHRDRLHRLGGESPTANVDANIATIVERHKLHFDDDILSKRLYGLLLSRLRDVRTSAELRELLSRSTKVGGLSLDPALANSVLRDLDAEAEKLHDRTTAGHLADLQVVRPKMPAPIPALQPAPKEPTPVAAAPVQRPAVAQARSPSAPVLASPTSHVPPLRSVPPPAQMMRPSPVPPPVAGAETRSPYRRPVAAPSGRPMIQDVKRPKPVSPAEELASLTPDDFRSLGRDLAESVLKVIEKIQLLGEESYEKRAEGVAAWRHSDVYQLYLSMGRDSLGSTKTIDEIVAERRRMNQSYLTANEFAAIADLNRHLTA